MSKLNGVWQFYYSEEQAEGAPVRNFVEIDGELKQYTEAVHASNYKTDDYEPHEDRYEDSELVASLKNPVVYKEDHLPEDKLKELEE